MNAIKNFAKFVTEKRQALGLSIADLSELVFENRRNTYIGELESGRKKGITIDVMEKILQALNSEISYTEL